MRQLAPDIINEEIPFTEVPTQMAKKYQLFQTICTHSKKIGLMSITMNNFIYPNEKDCRSILTAYFEFCSKYEDKEKDKQSNTPNLIERKITLSLKKWISNQWVLPDLLIYDNDEYYTEPEYNTDYIERVFNERKPLLPYVNDTLIQRHVKKIRDAEIQRKKAINNFGDTSTETHEDTIKIKIQQEMHTIQKEDLKSSINAIEPSTVPEKEEKVESKKEEEKKQEEPKEIEDPMKKLEKELDKIKAEKQEILDSLQKQLEELMLKHKGVDDAISAEIEDTKVSAKSKQTLDEIVLKLSEELSKLHQTVQAANNPVEIASMKKDEEVLTTQITVMNNEWQTMKAQLQENINTKKKKLDEAKIEYTYKIEQIEKMKKEIAAFMRDLQYKKEIAAFLEDEYSKAPKDISRKYFIERISEVVKNVKAQKVSIATTIDDIKNLKQKICDTITQIKAVSNDIDSLLFSEAQKDKLAKDIYKEIDSMKQHYSALISLIQQQNTIQNKIRETNNKSSDIKQKYQHVDASQLVKELDTIKDENKKIEEKLRNLQLLRSSIIPH